MEISEEEYNRLVKLTEELNQRINEIEGRQELSELYFVASQMRKKSIEEIVEAACIEYFSINIEDFRDTANISAYFKKGGRPRADEHYKKQVIQAQHWFISIMVNVLHKTTYSMKINYTFYNHLKLFNHRPVFMAAFSETPTNDTDKKNRNILMSLLSSIRNKMKDEKVFDEAFD